MNTHLAYRSYIGVFRNGKEKISNRTVRQCHYCKHLSICAAKEGITYSFDDSQIIDYQDNYKYMGDLSLSVYFDFETTTSNAIFFGSQIYVMSSGFPANPKNKIPWCKISKKSVFARFKSGNKGTVLIKILMSQSQVSLVTI